MRMRNIEFGMFLLSIGIVWLLKETGVIYWPVLKSLWNYWPALLIMEGINIIFRENPYVRMVTWFLFLAGLIAFSFYHGQRFEIPPNHYNETVWMIKTLPMAAKRLTCIHII